MIIHRRCDKGGKIEARGKRKVHARGARGGKIGASSVERDARGDGAVMDVLGRVARIGRKILYFRLSGERR